MKQNNFKIITINVETSSLMSAFCRVLDLRKVIVLAVMGFFFFGFLALNQNVRAQGKNSDALIRYYMETAREVFHQQDIRFSQKDFDITVVVRRFTLGSDADTLRLDTAIVRAFYSSQSSQSEVPDDSALTDSLWPDSVVVLRSSYLDDEPTLPALFVGASWIGNFAYSLFPNDPGRGSIALAYDSVLADGGLSKYGSNGVLTIERSSGEIQYLTSFIRGVDDMSRYSRETTFLIVEGYSMPEKIVEHINKHSYWGNQYEVRETLFLKLSFGS